jgi:hypothetical protein
MGILSVSLRPNGVEFVTPTGHELFPTKETDNVFTIRHPHGKFHIEATSRGLKIEWPVLSDMAPNMTTVASYVRPDHQFYPELLISLAEPIEVFRLV